MPIEPRFAEERESAAAASDVANTPTVTKECSAIDIAGVESFSMLRIRFRKSI